MKKIELKKAHSDKAPEISASELRALNAAQSDHQLAQEKYAHALTRAELVAHAAEAAAAKAELAAHEAKREAREKIATALAEHDAARTLLVNLTTEIRRAHNLTDKHAIDGLTGAIVTPEG